MPKKELLFPRQPDYSATLRDQIQKLLTNFASPRGEEIMVIDTTVFVDFFRGNDKAEQFLINSNETIVISRVVLMELVRGLKSKKDIKILLKQLILLAIEVKELDEEISQTAGILFETYYHSHGLGIMDALIAATAIVEKDNLITHNLKHFNFIQGLKLIKPY